MNPSIEHGFTSAQRPSLADAMSHVVDAGERLVSHRLELASVELHRTREKLQQVAQLAVAALLLAGSGWVFAMLALFWWLEQISSRIPAASAVAGLQLVLLFILIAKRDLFLGSHD